MANVLITYPHFKGFTDDGLPAEGYKVYVKNAGLSSDAISYSDHLCTVENTNPIILDSTGEAIIYVKVPVKLIYTLPDGDAGSPIWTMDYVGEQENTVIVTADATPGTTNNNYYATVSPVFTSLPRSITLILTPDTDSLSTIPTTTFTGTGKNDCVITGPYIGTTSGSVFEIQIETNGTPDTVKWRKDGGAWTTGVGITAGADQNMIEGVKFRFSESTGHVIGDSWTATVITPARLTFCDIGPYLIYKNVGGILVGLDAKDMIAGIPATLVWSEDNLCWILNNPSSSTSTAGATYGERSRKEETGDYTLLSSDKGNLIDFANTTLVHLYLDPAANYNGQFFYIRAGGTGNVIITAYGSELIKSVQSPTGSTYYNLAGGYSQTVQIQCNGVSWEVLTETRGKRKRTIYATPGSATWTMDNDTLYVEVECYGGGKGGDRIDTFSGSVSGGHGGGYGYKYIVRASLNATETVTVGGGGAGRTGSAGTGNNGGTSSFGSHVSALGGTASSPGTGVSGTINLYGGVGVSYLDETYVQMDASGGAGAGPFGGPPQVLLKANVAGPTGNYVGGGGAGAVAANAGDGANGLVIVTEIK